LRKFTLKENKLIRLRKILTVATFLVLLSTPVMAQDITDSDDLTSLSLEDLMNVSVTSVSKKPERLLDAASAIYVVTQEDIRRSGATNIPDALRRVPGIQVAQISANTWAITSRGLNSLFANKLLVLIDGRSVYTPLFSGVFWDVQDTLLEDIDRIEAIRGPGASLWGVNAVNGVINIITKKASDTQGGLLSTGYGNEQQGFGNLRYGSEIGNDAYFRVYSKYFNRDNSELPSGGKAHDRWHVLRGGFRIDWDVNNQDSLTVQGDIYDGTSNTTDTAATFTFPFTKTFNDDSDYDGWNVLSRWKRTFSEFSNIELQLYFDRTQRETAKFREDRDTFDVDFQHRFKFGKRHDAIWGLGYRLNHDNFRNSFSMSLTPDDRYMPLYSGFAQDEITLIEDKLRLTVGSKVSHNKFTGLEIQPNARLLWKPHERHSAWISFSRAVRTPSRAENDVRLNSLVIPGAFPPFSGLVSQFGNDGLDAEELYAYELGYRFVPSENLSVDLAMYYNNYDKLLTIEPGTPAFETSPQPPHLLIPFIGENEMDGEIFGLELAVDWRPVDWWHLKASYSYQQIQMHLNKSSLDIISESAEGTTPHNQFFLRSSFDLPKKLELDLSPRYTDNLSFIKIDSYVELDARLAWKPFKNLEMSLIGQNLLDSHHPEFKQSVLVETGSTEIERSVFAKIEWKF
jgi:iron complex outermembrane receptor protein